MVIFVFRNIDGSFPEAILNQLYKTRHNIITLQMNTCDPETYRNICNLQIVHSRLFYKCDKFMFVGYKLGAVWARYFGDKYDSDILEIETMSDINSLMDNLGLIRNINSGEISKLTYCNVKEYKYFITPETQVAKRSKSAQEAFDFLENFKN